jgi:flagellar biosynthesis protein FliQ
MKPHDQRKIFFAELWNGLKVVWPIVSALLILMVGLGIVIAWREGWKLLEGVYFAFVTGLTIGYGDLVPKQPISRILAIGIGVTGVLMVGLIVAIAVGALEAVTTRRRDGK